MIEDLIFNAGVVITALAGVMFCLLITVWVLVCNMREFLIFVRGGRLA